MAAITSLGVGSGMDLESIVTSLVSLKKTTKVNPIKTKEALKELQVTGLSNLKSSMTGLKDYLKTVSDGSALNKRTVTSTNDKDNPDFTYDLDKNVSNSSHDIAITQLAYGTKIQGKATPENFFSEKDADGNTVYRSKNTGEMSFTLGSGDDAETFSITVEENDSLETIMKKINTAEGNKSVSMNYIVGKDGSINFMLQSSKTGDGNDLRISGDSALFGIDGDGSANEVQKAQNANMIVDGIEVTSQTNKFSDQISGLDITAQRLSEKDSDGNYITKNLTVAESASEMKTVVNDFASKFNGVLSKCDSLYKKNTYTNGKCNYDGGDLAGDAICTAVQSALKSVINEFDPGNGKTLYEMGISIDKTGKMTVDSDKLGKMIDSNYDGLIGVMQKLSDKLTETVDLYTKSGTGILSQRSDSANNEWSDLKSKLTSMDEYMENYENRLRKKYTNLDTTLSNMNSNLSYITSIISSNMG